MQWIIILLASADTLHINLEQAKQLAVKANPEYKIEVLSNAYNKLNFYETISSNILTPEIQGDYSESDHSDDYKFEFSLNQPVFDVQQVMSILQSKSAMCASGNLREEAKNKLFYAIESYYFSVLKTQRLVELRQKAIESASENMRLVEKKLRVDKASLLDSLNAEVELNRTKLDYSRSRKNYELAQKTLLSALGIYQCELILEPVEMEKPYTLLPLDTLIGIGLKKSPLIKTAQEEVKQNRLSLCTGITSLLPQLSFRWLWTYTTNTLPTSFSEIKDAAVKSSGWGGTLRVNLFSYPLEVGKAKTALSKSELNLLNQRLQVAKTVELAWLECREASGNLTLVKSMFSAAEEATRLAKSQYEIGLISALDLFRVTTDRLEAEITYVATIYDYMLAKTKLQYAVGGEQ
ncbi:MAG: TolC family protein [Candidatus Stahlbacteria bacterium]|nr:TolC family protein [Candidatus Stahlbacteria bacterium]